MKPYFVFCVPPTRYKTGRLAPIFSPPEIAWEGLPVGLQPVIETLQREAPEVIFIFVRDSENLWLVRRLKGHYSMKPKKIIKRWGQVTEDCEDGVFFPNGESARGGFFMA